MAGVKSVWGAGAIQEGSNFFTNEQLEEAYKLLEEGGCKTIDTATLYGPSEEGLSRSGAAKRFTIDTKTVGGFKQEGDGGKKEVILAQGERSYELLGPVDIWYIHSPIKAEDTEEALAAINELYKKGYFKRFGLSNYKAEDVERIYDLAKSKGYPLPAVYQGNYNAVSRLQESLLFPTLRKLNIAFYAYSPIAGGFLTKDKEFITSGQGRFDPSNFIGQIYGTMYNRASLLEALSEWEAIAKDEGIPRAELAYRWIKYHSALKAEHGDAVIFGTSSPKQIKETLASLNKGPLSGAAVKRIDEVWETIKHEAPLDNYHDVVAK